MQFPAPVKCGYVYTPNNNESLANTQIMLLNQSNQMNNAFGVVDSQSRTYQLSNVQPGAYRIKVFHPGGLFLAAVDEDLTIAEGASSFTRDLNLSAGVPLSGRIVGKKTAGGQVVGLENVYLTLFDKLPPKAAQQPGLSGTGGAPNPADIPGIFRGETGNDGSFTIPIPGSGRYYLATMNSHGLLDKAPTASDVAYSGAGTEVVLSSVASATYEVRTAVSGSIGDIELESMDAVAGGISLTATRNGQGVAGANVTVGNPGTFFFREATTGEDGTVTIDKIPAGGGYIINIIYTDNQGNTLTGGGKRRYGNGPSHHRTGLHCPEGPQ